MALPGRLDRSDFLLNLLGNLSPEKLCIFLGNSPFLEQFCDKTVFLWLFREVPQLARCFYAAFDNQLYIFIRLPVINIIFYAVLVNSVTWTPDPHAPHHFYSDHLSFPSLLGSQTNPTSGGIFS